MVISAPLETPTVAVYSARSMKWGQFLTQKVPQKLLDLKLDKRENLPTMVS
jgi:hypothetical protein